MRVTEVSLKPKPPVEAKFGIWVKGELVKTVSLEQAIDWVAQALAENGGNESAAKASIIEAFGDLVRRS